MSIKANKEQPLPKWFHGVLYSKGGTVANPFSGAEIGLTPAELSMYDFIMGCVYIGKQDQTFVKALNWFRRANPDAYMVLLD